MAEFRRESPVATAIFPRNAGIRRYFVAIYLHFPLLSSAYASLSYKKLDKGSARVHTFLCCFGVLVS